MPWWRVLFSSTMLVFDFFFPFVFTFWNSYCLGVGLPRLSLQIPCLFSFLSYFLYLWVFALLFHEISSILLSNPSSFHFCHHLYVFLIPESSFVWSFSIATLSLFLGGGCIAFYLSEDIDTVFEVVFSLHNFCFLPVGLFLPVFLSWLS